MPYGVILSQIHNEVFHSARASPMAGTWLHTTLGAGGQGRFGCLRCREKGKRGRKEGEAKRREKRKKKAQKIGKRNSKQ